MFISSGIISSRNSTVITWDEHAKNLFDAAQITSSTVKDAVNTLILAAKSNGWWNSCRAIYGFAGDGFLQSYESQYKYNWKDARDLDAAFRLTFSGGITHSSTGSLPNGTDGEANTHLVPATALTSGSNHLSFYSRTNTDGDSLMNDMGANAINPGFRI